jgi:hypothetical protein
LLPNSNGNGVKIMGDLSELIYYATHTEDDEEIVPQMKFDVSFLLYLVPEEHEWILGLMKEDN